MKTPSPYFAPGPSRKAPSGNRVQRQTPRTTSRDRLAVIERRKNRSRVMTVVITVLMIMLVTMMLIMIILRQNQPKPRFQFIQQGSISHSIEADALIIRDETVLESTVSGTVRALVSEGVRIAAGERLAMIVQPGMEDVLVELNNCEQQIAEIQIELMESGDVPGAMSVFNETDEDLLSIVRMIRRDMSNGRLDSLNAYSSSIDLLLEDREGRLMSVEFQDARLEQLATQRENLTRQLGENAGEVSSPMPGIVSFRFDGLEISLSPEIATTMTPDQFEVHLNGLVGYREAQATVGTNEPIVRISNGLEQYLMFLVPASQADRFQPGSLHDVSIPGEGITIEGFTVVSAAESPNGALVVLHTDRQVSRLFDRRTVSCEISIPSLTVEGLRVPTSALVSEGNDTWILVLQSGVARHADVRVLDQDRSYAIVEPVGENPFNIRVSSIVVVNPESVQEGERVSD